MVDPLVGYENRRRRCSDPVEATKDEKMANAVVDLLLFMSKKEEWELS